MSSAQDIEPFRVEWRHNAVTRWSLIHTRATRSDAEALAEATLIEHRGQVRVVEQRVVRAKGLGLNVSCAPRVAGVVNPLSTVTNEETT